MKEENSFLKRLEAVHTFPGSYMFKVIGVNTEKFVLQVVQAATLATKGGEKLSLKTKESTAGRHVSVTLTADVEDAEMVLEVYRLLQTVDDVHFIA